MQSSEGVQRAKTWLRAMWPDAKMAPLDVQIDGVGWLIQLPNGKRLTIQFTGQMLDHGPTLERQLKEAEANRKKIEAVAPGTVIISSDRIDSQHG